MPLEHEFGVQVPGPELKPPALTTLSVVRTGWFPKTGRFWPVCYLARPMPRYIKPTFLLSLGLAAAIGLAACGGSDQGETPIVVTGQTETLTKDEFITQADALCDTVNSQVTDIANAGEGITRAADVAALRTQLVSDIRNLGTPVDDSSSTSETSTGSTTSPTPDVTTFPGDTTSDTTADTTSDTTATGTSTASSLTSTGNDLEDFLAALGAEAKAGEKIDLANQRGEDTSAGEAELNDAKDKAATAAGAYGFTICGTDGTTSTDTSQDPSISTDSSSGTSAAPSTVTPVVPDTSSSGGSSSSGTSTSSSGSSGSSSGGGVSAGGGVGPG
jgi:hypothetical protein